MTTNPSNNRRLRSLADTYKEDPNMERMIELRRKDPASFASLVTPMVRMSLGSYETAKAAYEEVNK